MATGESPSRIAGEELRSDSRTGFRPLAWRNITLSFGIDNISAISRYDISSTSQRKSLEVMQRQILDGAPLTSPGLSRRLLVRHKKLNDFSALIGRNPSCGPSKSLRYVVFNYLCHCSCQSQPHKSSSKKPLADNTSACPPIDISSKCDPDVTSEQGTPFLAPQRSSRPLRGSG